MPPARTPYANNHRSIGETADALLEAFLARARRLRGYLDEMANPAFVG